MTFVLNVLLRDETCLCCNRYSLIDTEKLTGLRIRWSQVKINMVQLLPMDPAQPLVTFLSTELINVHVLKYLNPCQ
jgi:hypothetical protein